MNWLTRIGTAAAIAAATFFSSETALAQDGRVKAPGTGTTEEVKPGGTNSGVTGACCFCLGTSRACLVSTEDACNARFGGTYLGDGTTCASGVCDAIEAFGACIYAANGALICYQTDQTECDSRGGTMYGCETCDEVIADIYDVTGACCANDGTCVDDVRYIDCFGSDDDGFYHGWQSTCASTDCLGACCYVNGELEYVCVQLNQDDCESIDGANFQGIGEPCDAGACQECPDIPDVSCNPGGETEIHTRDFSFSAGPAGAPAQFVIGGDGLGEPDAIPLFNTNGGERVLTRVAIEVEADLLSRVTMENEDQLLDQAFDVSMTLGNLVLLPTVRQIPGPPHVLWNVQNPQDDCTYTTQSLGYLEREILTGGIFSAIEEAQAGGAFGPCTDAIGNGSVTLDSCPGGVLENSNFEGTGTFNLTLQAVIQYSVQETNFDLNNDLNLVEGKVRVVYCFDRVGACCLPETDPDAPCVETTEDDCNKRMGYYLGDGTECCMISDYGACCYDDNGTVKCVETCEECCEFLYGGFSWVADTDCGFGACCHPCDGTCAIVASESICTASGGIWQGLCTDCDDADCPTSGACCHPCDGTCTEVESEAACIASGGVWQGLCTKCADIKCPTSGACCDPCDGTCTEVENEAACTASGGIWQGFCTKCADVDCRTSGACCDPCDGTCTEVENEAACTAIGGIWQGFCTKCIDIDCPTSGACCDPCDGTCTEVADEAACIASGGIWQGFCTTCVDVDCPEIGACCVEPGNCVEDLTEAECTSQGGEWGGPCSTCDDIECSGGGEGCTPGYWRQPHHFWAWEYDPNTLFNDVFEGGFPGLTLHEVVWLGGGQINALGRHTVAALLNAASPYVDYGMTPAEVIAAYNDVYPGSNGDYENLKDQFEELNESGCPIGNGPPDGWYTWLERMMRR